MGTPGFPAILLRSEKLTTADWHKLIEARRELILHILDSVTLSTLGQVVRNGVGTNQVFVYDNEDRRFKEQGLFKWGDLSWPRNDKQPGEMVVWGLERRGNWVVAQVPLTYIGFNRISAPSVGSYRRVKLDEMIRVINEKCFLQRPAEYRVHYVLSEAVAEWTKKRRKLYEEISWIDQTFKVEDEVISTNLVR